MKTKEITSKEDHLRLFRCPSCDHVGNDFGDPNADQWNCPNCKKKLFALVNVKIASTN